MTPRSKALVAVIGSMVLVIAFAGLVAARLFIFNYSVIPQNGMYPGIPSGSLVFSWRHPYRSASDVQRGDVVLFTRTEDGQASRFIWRVIGLPGDKVEIDGEAILLNGQAIRRERLRQDRDMIIFREDLGSVSYEVAYPQNRDASDQPKASVTVPPNSFYLLGDNRFDALDSRFLGPITFDSILERKF